MLVEQRGGAGFLDNQQPGYLSTFEHAHFKMTLVKNYNPVQNYLKKNQLLKDYK